jgi:hypothetical protein
MTRYIELTQGRSAWVAQIWVRGEYKYLGLFEDVTDAAMEYDRVATENFGEFASVNFPSNGGN